MCRKLTWDKSIEMTYEKISDQSLCVSKVIRDHYFMNEQGSMHGMEILQHESNG